MMADNFNSWGSAGASAGGWGDGMVQRAARGLGRWMGDGMPASQQMRDWYQQYAAEHGQNNTQWGWKRDNYPQPSGNTMQWMWQRDSYAGPIGTIGQKGLRDVPAEGQQSAAPWVYKANPYSQEQLDRMAREGIYARTPGYWGVDTDGNAVWNPETINNAYGGSFSAESSVPGYVTDMNAVVAAMNHVNNGGSDPYYLNMINRYKSDPNLLLSNANQIDRMIEQAQQEMASGGRTQWANTILQTYLPQQQAYRAMMHQFNDAFQQWQPNPGGGTSWQQTATPWQGAAQYLEQMQQPVAAPVQVSPEPQKQVHDVAPQQVAPQPAAAPTGFSGINPNLLAAIRRGRGA